MQTQRCGIGWGAGSFLGAIILGSFLALIILIIGSGKARAQETSGLTPRQVVEQWIQVYPVHLEEAAELTGKHYRAGVSKEKWIATQGPYLRNLRMKYVDGEIAHEEIVEKEAHVSVHAQISTILGKYPHDELYVLLKNPEGRWVIDRVDVYPTSHTDRFTWLP